MVNGGGHECERRKESLVRKVLKMLQGINELVIGVLPLRDLDPTPHPLSFLLKCLVFTVRTDFYT